MITTVCGLIQSPHARRRQSPSQTALKRKSAVLTRKYLNTAGQKQSTLWGIIQCVRRFQHKGLVICPRKQEKPTGVKYTPVGFSLLCGSAGVSVVAFIMLCLPLQHQHYLRRLRIPPQKLSRSHSLHHHMYYMFRLGSAAMRRPAHHPLPSLLFPALC